jgi:hypothetical protein
LEGILTKLILNQAHGAPLLNLSLPSPTIQWSARLSKKSRSRQLLTSLVSISTTNNFYSVKKCRYWQFWKLKSPTDFHGFVLYSLDNFHLGLNLSLEIYCRSLSLGIETGIEKVSVSISTLRPGFPKSQYRSRDSNLSIANPCHYYHIIVC